MQTALNLGPHHFTQSLQGHIANCRVFEYHFNTVWSAAFSNQSRPIENKLTCTMTDTCYPWKRCLYLAKEVLHC